MPNEPEQPDYPARIKEWYAANWRHGPCPVCGNAAFIAGGAIYEFARFNPRIEPADRFIPVFAVTCGVCGYQIWINALATGVFQAGEGSTKVEEPDS
jgi:ribosomal protein S27AE